MIIITDTREQEPLKFLTCEGVTHQSSGLAVGDYSALIDGAKNVPVVERKSIPDLFSSFSMGYEHEKNKILKAKALRLKYILAIEGTVTRVLQGHTFWDGKEEREHKKSGISQLRQLLTISIRYGVECWYCKSREEMAIKIQEYFLAYERNLKNSTSYTDYAVNTHS